MSVIREVIENIDFWSPPLKKHRYQMNSVRRKVFISPGKGSGLLIDELQKRDRLAAASGILESRPSTDDTETSVYTYEEFINKTGKEETEKPEKRRFRVIRRIEEIIYDDAEIKLGELQDEAYDVLNDDGFYDEILPADYDEEYEKESSLPIKEIALYGAILLVTIGTIAWIVMNYIL